MRVIAVVGPTAAGKSDLGVALAHELDGEIVNADSMQLYRGMDIGTAKLTLAEREGVPHHLLDVWDVRVTATAAAYQGLCRTALDRIAKTGVAMELNTSGVNKAIREINPSPTMLALMRARGIPVVLGADAHRPGRVADGYADALRTLADAGYTEVSYFLDRRRQTLPITDALASLP